jgi:hypothetical protein
MRVSKLVYTSSYINLNTFVVDSLILVSNCMYERIKVEMYAIPMACSRCSYAWNYTGKNEYVATCPLCRTKLSIKKNNRIMQTGLENETPSQFANITDEGKSERCKITKKRGMTFQRHHNSVLTRRLVKQDELL